MKIFGTPEEGAIKQAEICLKDADHFALMADNHKGYNMPIGGVALYKDKLSPAGVGFDIACGNKAVKLDIKHADIIDRLPAIAEEIFETLSFGVGLKNKEKVEHPLFDSPKWDTIPFYKENPQLKELAKAQLGTIGSGNHYVDIFKDTEDNIWIGVHFGSRGLGHKTATEYIKRAGGNPNAGMDDAPALLDANTRDGQEYLEAMNLAGDYAYAGRDWVCQKVADIIGANIIDEVHNHHNFTWIEIHNGEYYYVVRKGATPAFPGQKGFIGASMGEDAVIVEGLESDESRESFYSTVHGAGRVMSRTQAAGKKRFRKRFKCGQRDCDGNVQHHHLKPNEEKPKCPKCGSNTNLWKGMVQISEGVINMDEVKKEMVEKGIILKGAGADEAPGAYKRLDEVLEHHKGTIEILERLTPLIVCMAGSDEFDPYKD